MLFLFVLYLCGFIIIVNLVVILKIIKLIKLLNIILLAFEIINNVILRLFLLYFGNIFSNRILKSNKN